MVQVLGLGTPTAGSLGSIPARGTNILQKKIICWLESLYLLQNCITIVFLDLLYAWKDKT